MSPWAFISKFPVNENVRSQPNTGKRSDSDINEVKNALYEHSIRFMWGSFYSITAALNCVFKEGGECDWVPSYR